LEVILIGNGDFLKSIFIECPIFWLSEELQLGKAIYPTSDIVLFFLSENKIPRISRPKKHLRKSLKILELG
tara:strand:- start:863 stop:1075 length:213 start_codon:yes stop_codon:yes gene_type:complete